jgi:hypothetical protein
MTRSCEYGHEPVDSTAVSCTVPLNTAAVTDIPADTDFLCDKAIVLRVKIKGTSCTNVGNFRGLLQLLESEEEFCSVE